MPFAIDGNLSISPAVFEIFSSKRTGVTSSTLQGHVASLTIWLAIGHILLVVLWNQSSIDISVSEISTGETETGAMIDMTLNDL